MSKIKKKNERRFHLPKRSGLLYLLLVLIPVVLFFLIAIPVIYVKEYKATKITPFATALESVDSSQIVYGGPNEIPDFNFVIYCKEYSQTESDDANTIKFSWFAYRNDKTAELIKDSDQITVRISLYHDWMGKEYTYSSSGTSKKIAPDLKKVSENSTYRMDTASISSVPNLPYKGKLPFVKVKTLPLYVYITYNTTVKGTVSTKHYVLKYEYEDYMVEKTTLNDGENTYSYGPSAGGLL